MTLIIAEIGVNHNGNLDTAIEMIGVASECGADAVKFQLFVPERLEPHGPRREMLSRLMLDPSDMVVLKAEADRKAVQFICTPFDEGSLDYLVNVVGVDTLKISSGSIGDRSLLEAARRSKKDVILSTGMANMQAVLAAKEILGNPIILHCVSAYPTEVSDINLRAMVALRKTTECLVGLSDHTTSTLVPAFAVTLGAVVIEKHFTLYDIQEGPDHRMSLEPGAFKEMVENIGWAEAALGNGTKSVASCEERTVKIKDARVAWRERNAV